jgi:oxygen-independent coproporphyrinogen-3 oxidase
VPGEATLSLTPFSTLSPSALPPDEIQALYVHVPFCFHKCHYCDFYSITRQTPQRMDRFVELVLQEAEQWTAIRSSQALRPRTIFFGGGTPSLLPLEAMRRLLLGLHDRFDLSRVEEWTIEVNPATADEDYLGMLREFGVDRLSFGAQSFRPDELATLERHHDPRDVPRSIELARRAGFQRLSVDLIYAVPGQDLASWAYSLEQALELGTEHLSCYGLTYEPNTPMGVKHRLGAITAVEDSVELEMLHYTRQRLIGAELPPYEISNYSRPDCECRHNLLYWTGGNYLGLGPSAASHLSGWRWRNRPHLGEWEQAISAGTLPGTDIEHLSPLQRAGELAMLMLRLTSGINFSAFKARTGHSPAELFPDAIDRLTRLGMVQTDSDSIRLTRTGLNVADAVSAEFLAPADP